MVRKEISMALIQRDIQVIRPSSLTDKFSTLPMFHPVEVTVRSTNKKGETEANSIFDIKPVLFVNNGSDLKHIFLGDNSVQFKIDETIYIVKSLPTALETAPSSSVTERMSEPVTPSETLDQIYNFITKYIDFQDDTHIPKFIALYIMGTYVYSAFPAFPYLWLHGESGTGKSRLLQIISILSYYGIFVSKISASALYRTVEGTGSTVCIDEAEKLWGEKGDTDLIQMLNAGYKEGGKAFLVDKQSRKAEVFNVYSPKVLASIKGLEATIENRAVLVVMRRTSKNLDKLMVREDHARPIRDNLYLWRLKEGALLVHDFKAWDTIQTANELGIAGRAYEIFIPAVFLCKAYKPEWLADLTSYIHEYEEIKKSLEENTLEANIMSAIYNIIIDKPGVGTINAPNYEGFVAVHEIGEMLSRIGSEFNEVKSRTIGHCLRRIGFMETRKIGGKSLRKVHGKVVMQYLESHRIDYTIKPPSAPENPGKPQPIDIEQYNLSEVEEKGNNDSMEK